MRDILYNKEEVEHGRTYITKDEVEEYRERVKTLETISDALKESPIKAFAVYGHALYSLVLDFDMYMADFICRMPKEDQNA